MSLDAIEGETGPSPTASIIVLHGLGADGNDFVPIAEQLDLTAVGTVRFIFPHAPTRPVTVNGGHVMRAWYDILGPAIDREEDAAGLHQSREALEVLIGREKSRGIPASRIVLMGFSQGCAMSLLTGLRHAERLAGLACLSGYLPLAASTAAERAPANADLPIFQAHGTVDPVIAIERAVVARDALLALGHPVEWHAYPMAHSVHPQEVADLNAWLLRVLAR